MKKAHLADVEPRLTAHKYTTENFAFFTRFNPDTYPESSCIVIIQILYQSLFQLQSFKAVIFYLEVKFIGSMPYIDLVFIEEIIPVFPVFAGDSFYNN